MKTLNEYSVLGLLCLLVASCSPTEVTTPELADEDSALPGTPARNAQARAACDQCNTGDHPKDNYNLSGFTMEEIYGSVHSNPNATSSAACEAGVFNTCNGYMVISGPDGDSERVELKQYPGTESLSDAAYLKFRTIVENIPGSGKEVTIAQIHNRGSGVQRPLLRLSIRNGGYLTSTLAHQYSGSSSYTKDDWFQINHGDRIVVELKILGSGNRVRWWVKNYTTGQEQRVTYDLDDSAYDDWKDKSGTFYFKTGVYNQDAFSSPMRLSYYYFQFSS